tara:strand:- start:279 stop:932 length:654 start_codon:yes stop_codon:yes gene_type:complete
MALVLNGSNDTITGLQINSANIVDGSIVDADISGMASSKLSGALPAISGAALTGVGGKFASYAVIADVKGSNADGGTFTTGAWRTRDLNTEISDADSIVSISSNQFTLAAGSYCIIFSAQAHQPNSHQTRLYNATTSANVQFGQAMYNSASVSVTTASRGVARVTISGSTVFEIQHRCASTKTTFGLGVGGSGNMNWGGSAATDGAIYCTVEIYKEA